MAKLVRPRWRAPAALAALLAVCALLMIPAFDQPGAEVDEGLLVSFPARLLHGEVPQRDFYDPYGPGTTWVVAAADEVFGTTLSTERAVGMVYRLALIAAVFALALCWGLGAALVAAAIVASTLVGSIGANAVIGCLALSMLGYALLGRCVLRPSSRTRRLLPAAGMMLAASLTMRYDFAPALVLAALPGVLAVPSAERHRFVAGALIGLVPLAIHVGLASPAAVWRSLRIGLEGRSHPARPPFGSDLAELVTLYALATIGLLCAGALIERRARRDPEARVLLGSGLWGVGLGPFALSHLDAAHVIVSSIPVLAMLPAGALVLIRGDPLQRPTPPAARAFALGTMLVIVFMTAASVIRGSVYHQAKLLLTGKRDSSFIVSNDGRSFRLADPQAAHDVQAMLVALDRLARPGQTLFVGPQDLRTAGANDIFVYFLADQLRPSSYFMEVDPNTINRPSNGFVRELERTDFALLTTRLTHFPLTDVGSPTANQILATRFCLRAESGTYKLYQRCR